MQGFIRIEIWCIIHFEMDFLLQPICSFKMFPMKKKKLEMTEMITLCNLSMNLKTTIFPHKNRYKNRRLV